MENLTKKVKGTLEWCHVPKNIISGCPNSCRYCYAKYYAVLYGRETIDSWLSEKVNIKKADIKHQKSDSTVMYPSTHDITLKHINIHFRCIRNLVNAYSKVLIVTKPNSECIHAITKEFAEFKNKILFRFTIGSSNDDVLRFWEPCAPNLRQRFESLIIAYERGFKTSVSCEPMLDNNIDDLIKKIKPYITDSIWLGKMNDGLERLTVNGYGDDETIERYNQLMDWQTDENIKAIYEKYKDDPLIKYKESIKKVIGLKIPLERGLDS